MAKDEDKEPSERPSCTVSAKTYRYLEMLAKAGAHGSSRVSGVMTALISQGIQDAIGRGIIPPFDD